MCAGAIVPHRDKSNLFDTNAGKKDTSREFVTKMIETLNMVKEISGQARDMDPLLITGGRASIVGRNLGQIEGLGRVRNRVYVHRLAGKSIDIIRKSQTERHVEWLGATVFENPHLLSVVSEFYAGMFARVLAARPVMVLRGYWAIDEDSDCLRAARRSAYVSGDMARVTDLTLRLKQNEKEVLEFLRVSAMARR